MAANIEDGGSAAVWIPRCQDMSVSFWNGVLNLLNILLIFGKDGYSKGQKWYGPNRNRKY